MIKVKFLLHSTFRSNPAFELIEQGNLNQQELHALADLSQDPEFFGVFRRKHTEAAGSAKLAYKEVALLFYFLRNAGGLPQYFKSGYDDEVNLTMAKLILEGIFEIRVEQRFYSGSAAQHFIYEFQEQGRNRQHPLLELSSGAIRYAVQLNEVDTTSLASKLYAYNTVPLLFMPANALKTFEEVEAFLRIGKNEPLTQELLKNWNKHEPDRKYSWISWSRKQNRRHDVRLEPTYKIYISPVLEELPAVFEKAVRVLTGSDAFSFKIGMNREGLLRPDKFVAYFTEFDHLITAADRLGPVLKAHKAQGVPFTASLDDAGMLSWGMDSASDEILKNREGGSWRAAVTEKLAASISLSKTEKLNQEESVDFVLKKMMLEGVDTTTWTAV
ncbi:hypothetical protein [Dyadobacter fanqingshengii]|uniref:Uncharacterized protein n=1 Tax=Dyadobacter fanqingshengii TaxID=2906443 RepID=A0A9X1PA18_9BACT|nr:hypothetical protein [Dyadobacter fanqingshengii]MCF0041409.1 hypothetical protein [Dyadobacter fanqingshengii]USJ36870.1 hypothetical protein NFI81_03655 [Dyadobacter fanqingshengii]